MGNDASDCNSRIPYLFRHARRCLIMTIQVDRRLVVIRLSSGECLIYVFTYRNTRRARYKYRNVAPSFGNRLCSIFKVRVGQVKNREHSYEVFCTLICERGKCVTHVNRASVSMWDLRAFRYASVPIKVRPCLVCRVQSQGVSGLFICHLAYVIRMMLDLSSRWVCCFRFVCFC